MALDMIAPGGGVNGLESARGLFDRQMYTSIQIVFCLKIENYLDT